MAEVHWYLPRHFHPSTQTKFTWWSEFLLPDSRKSVLVGVQIAVRVAVLVRIQIRRDPDLDLDPIFQTRARMHGAFYATEEPLV